jgi:hypothetical protein
MMRTLWHRLHAALYAALHAANEWINVPICKYRQFEFVRLDIVLFALALFSIGYYGYLFGWRGALRGGASFALFVVLARAMRTFMFVNK